MRTPIRLWLLLSCVAGLIAGPVLAQVPVSPDTMRIDPVTQHERDKTRLRILQDELATETRELDAAQTELNDAQASRAASGKVQEITERITLHRQNVAALEREISLTDRPADNAIRSAERRQPDNWLISGQRLVTAKPSDILARRRLPQAEPEVKLPEWVIRGGFTVMGP